MRMGLDIGYSSVKLSFAKPGGQRHELILPVGAAPIERSGTDYLGGDSGIRVMVDGEPYLAGIPPHMVADWSRSLDRAYTESRQYRALYHAALACTGASRIECVATGLPVSQYFNKALREQIARQLMGHHRIGPDRVVKVCDARVYPQPAGMYISYLSRTPGATEAMSERTALVIDPGFFSVDSVVIRHNRPYPQAAATSTEAMSRVLEMADEAMTRTFDDVTAMPGLYKASLEERLREGRTSIFCGGREVDALPYLERASEMACDRALPEIASSLRGLAFNIDVVLVAGGGAGLYAPAIRRAFRRQRVAVMENASMANADGFLVLAGFGHE